MNGGELARLSRTALEGAGWPEETLPSCHGDSEMREGIDKSQFSTQVLKLTANSLWHYPSLGYTSRISSQSYKPQKTFLTSNWRLTLLCPRKAAQRRVLFTRSALLSNASPDTHWALQRNSHAFPSTDDDGFPVAGVSTAQGSQFHWSQPAAGDKLEEKKKV